MRFIYLLLPTLLAFFLFVSCSGTKSTTSQHNESKEISVAYGKSSQEEITGSVQEIKPDQPNLTLADYLRRVPGVSVRGTGDRTKVVIRGGITGSGGSNEPLYVINNVPSGNNYAMIETMVDVNDIENISVLKDASSSNMYGVRAQHGVIIIETKRAGRRN